MFWYTAELSILYLVAGAHSAAFLPDCHGDVLRILSDGHTHGQANPLAWYFHAPGLATRFRTLKCVLELCFERVHRLSRPSERLSRALALCADLRIKLDLADRTFDT